MISIVYFSSHTKRDIQCASSLPYNLTSSDICCLSWGSLRAGINSTTLAPSSLTSSGWPNKVGKLGSYDWMTPSGSNTACKVGPQKYYNLFFFLIHKFIRTLKQYFSTHKSKGFLSSSSCNLINNFQI